MPVKISAGTPPKDDLFLSASVFVLQTDRCKLCRVRLRINKSQLLKEVMHRLENESELLECFYGCGQDLTTGNLYRLKRNPSNPKDDSCIELTENGVVKATMNARLSKLMAPLIDNAIIREPEWYD